jgi:hypothetical protein
MAKGTPGQRLAVEWSSPRRQTASLLHRASGNSGKMGRVVYDGETTMSSTATRTVFDVITDFLASDPTPDQLIAYHLPDDLQARVDQLVERNGEGQLTFDDQQELLDFMRADEMIALLKAKTKLRLRKTDQ